MNGRIYDPDTARFLSPDPYLQAPANFQNYNRYSYVLNNPVSMTDPSGHFFFIVAAIISSVVSAAVAVTSFAIAAISAGIGMAGAWLAAASTAQLVTAALLTYGAISSYQAGGFKGLVLFAATAFVTAGVGSYFDAAQALSNGIQSGIELARAVTHGIIVQGGFAELQGGDFGSSFLSGFTGSIAGSMITAKSGDKSFFGAKNEGGKYLARRTVAAAVVGGTTSEIAGGKFANGAVTAAMVHLLNAEGHHAEEKRLVKSQIEFTSGLQTYEDAAALRKYAQAVGSEFDDAVKDVIIKGTNNGNLKKLADKLLDINLFEKGFQSVYGGMQSVRMSTQGVRMYSVLIYEQKTPRFFGLFSSWKTHTSVQPIKGPLSGIWPVRSPRAAIRHPLAPRRYQEAYIRNIAEVFGE